jgi:tetraacyldisaccharide 4'-kinase
VLLAGALAQAPGALVVAGPDRVAGARLLESLGSEVVLCDDGLQHYALERDAEIVVVDGLRGLGNGRLLPAGPLREPVARLERADLVVVNDGDAADPVPAAAARISNLRGRRGAIRMRVAPQAVRQLRAPSVVRPVASFAGTPVHAVAGIGAPERFFAALERAGLRVLRHPFPDHHPFVPGDLEFGDGHPVLMTGKDAVKCRAFAQERMWEVTVRPQVDAADAALLLSLCERGA